MLGTSSFWNLDTRNCYGNVQIGIIYVRNLPTQNKKYIALLSSNVQCAIFIAQFSIPKLYYNKSLIKIGLLVLKFHLYESLAVFNNILILYYILYHNNNYLIFQNLLARLRLLYFIKINSWFEMHSAPPIVVLIYWWTLNVDTKNRIWRN